ncbi:hypothetical protein M413DRAFT_438740 [Hebeloma cylindrosporum]|uniref:F-box domain-containing protein n=1 Tax=Hebeloma cylindrosporum TaxID=76867 RepID=A0A0C2Z8V7_HEBCY|nr:hypothetical protein M413DRAFT_438740 [Hebeloma cylindrosporum h7]
MTRRTRVLKSAPQAMSVDLPSDDGDFNDSEFDEEMEVAAKKPRGKKRKTSGNNDVGPPQAKKARHVRGKRGILKQLVEMPFDVLFEIFGRLEPLDLVHLSRTSKDLRALLLTRTSISTWKESLANVPGLPECPDDMTEPQYAELVFGKCCHFCHRNFGMIQTMWDARLRACTKCLETNRRFKELSTHYPYRNYGPDLYKLLPVAEVSRKSGRYNRIKRFTDATLDETWETEYLKLEGSPRSQDDWVRNKIQEMTLVHKHTEACLAWVADVHNRREAEKQAVIDNRKAIVVERLKAMGWAEELALLDSSAPRPEDSIFVAKACQKDLTEKVLSSLEEPLTRFMEAIKSTRVEKERRALLKDRLAALNTLRETCVSTLPANAICPTSADLFRLPLVRNIIDTVPATVDFTADDLQPIALSFDDLTLQWRKEIELKLLGLIQAAEGSDVQNSLDAEAVLNLATSFFSCKHCDRFLRYPAVLMHSCATKSSYNFPPKDDPDRDHVYAAEFLRQIYWNADQSITRKPEHVAVVSRLLDMVGFDAKTATVEDMDALNPLFECTSCNSFSEGRAIMTWQTVLVHRFQRHRFEGDIELVLLDETESAVIRPRILEHVDRERHRGYHENMICVLCKKLGKRLQLREHIRKDHSKPNPADEDIVLKIDVDPIPSIYRQWPPREVIDKPATV